MWPASLYIDVTKFLFGRLSSLFFFVFFFLVPVNFACYWYPGELSPVAGVNAYHIMHSPCNTIPLSLLVTSILTEVYLQTKWSRKQHAACDAVLEGLS